jgi:Ca2+:H+ antiporter
MLASFIIVLLGISVTSSDHASHHVKAISIVGAIALLVTYVTWVVPYLRSDNASPGHESAASKNSLVLPIVLLTIAGAGAAFVSDWFVSALTPTIDRLHISQAFAGIVIVAIAGNAVENVAGIMLAAKGQADLAISVVKNSVAQVAAFLYPALILVSLLFSTPLTFSLAPIYIGALLLSALAVWQISGDSEASAFEGVALIAIYVVLGVITIYE